MIRVVLEPAASSVRLDALADESIRVRGVSVQADSAVQYALLHGDRARVVEALQPYGQATVVSQSSLSAVEGHPALLNVGRRRAGGTPEQVLAVRVRPQVTPDGAIRLDVLPERLRQAHREIRPGPGVGRDAFKKALRELE